MQFDAAEHERGLALFVEAARRERFAAADRRSGGSLSSVQYASTQPATASCDAGPGTLDGRLELQPAATLTG